MARPLEFDADQAVGRAADLFWSVGYAGATPARLTEAMGIGRGSLYNTFGSKVQLYDRALRWYVEHETAALVDILDDDQVDDASGLDRIRRALDLVVEATVADTKGRGCLLTNAAVETSGHTGDADEIVRRGLAQQNRAFADAVRDGQRTGHVAAAVDPTAAALSLVATLNGLRAMARGRSVGTSHRAALDGLVTHALRGLTA